jgi:hypothetical protein
MKKKIYAITIALLVIASITTITVLAKTIHSDWVEKKIEKGFTETDAYSMMAIMVLGEENVSAFVEQKYRDLGNWEKVAEHYDVDLEEFNAFVDDQIQLAELLEIPDDIYAEMTTSGMTDAECKEFARLSHNAQIDIATTWEAKQNGKTINDLIKEQTELKNAQGQAATDLAFGKISEKEYMAKMQELSPDMPMSEILEFAVKEKKGWMNFRKAASGISDEEIALAEKAGMTDFFAICRMKDAEKISKLTFAEMVVEVKKGATVDKVISDNVSAEKVESAKADADTATE